MFTGTSPDFNSWKNCAPIKESGDRFFLFPKLSRNLPIRYSFPTLTIYGLRVRTFPFGRILNDRDI